MMAGLSNRELRVAGAMTTPARRPIAYELVMDVVIDGIRCTTR